MPDTGQSTGMQANRRTRSFIIILDDEASTYLAQVAGSDANQYLVNLLRAEQQRQATRGSTPASNTNRLYETIAETPDTSGYPQMADHFRPINPS